MDLIMKTLIIILLTVGTLHSQTFHVNELADGHPMRETRIKQIEDRAFFYLNVYRKEKGLHEIKKDTSFYKMAKDHANYLESRGKIHYKYNDINTFYLSHDRGYKVNGITILTYNEHTEYYGINPAENCGIVLVFKDSIDVNIIAFQAITTWKNSHLHNLNMIGSSNYGAISASYVNVNYKRKNVNNPMISETVNRKMFYFVLTIGEYWNKNEYLHEGKKYTK